MPSFDTSTTTACRSSRRSVARLTTVAAGLLVGIAAHATQIVGTVVVAPSLAGANSIDATDWMAESFGLTSTATIDSVAVQALDTSPVTDAGLSFQVAIYGSSRGVPALDFNAANQGRIYTTNVTYTADGWSGVTGLQWLLAPGAYWLAVEATSDANAVTGLVLPTGAQGAVGGVAFYSGASSYTMTGVGDAFGLRINAVSAVSAVPEPASGAMLLLGLGALVLARKATRSR